MQKETRLEKETSLISKVQIKEIGVGKNTLNRVKLPTM
jgi:hypothetical protein